MKAAMALLALAACSKSELPQTLELFAHESHGLGPAEQIIIPDAKTRIPALLKSCGVNEVVTIVGTDGVVVFQFAASSNGSEVRCIKSKLPAGMGWL